MKPILVYPGSKHDFYPELRKRIPQDIRVFCEPFVGGGSTTLNLLADMEFDVDRVVLGDASPAVAAFWRSVLSDPEGLSCRYDELFRPFDEVIKRLGTRRAAFLEIEWFGGLPEDSPQRDSTRYQRIAPVRQALYDLHAALSALEPEDEVTVAARMALLHNISYSGIMYHSGVSYQRITRTELGGRLDDYKRAASLLRSAHAEIVCGDFEETCSRVLSEEDTFIYLDPPYVLQAENLYEHGSFDHTRLSEYLKELSPSVRVLLSYDDSAFIRALYRGRPEITIEPYTLPRGYRIGAAGRTNAGLNGEELFIKNYQL